MRHIIDHAINPVNEKLKIVATDEMGSGGANQRYEITGFNPYNNPSYDGTFYSPEHMVILFQNRPIESVGVNGITQEALLAVVADRLRCFQAGPYACRENALALTKVEEAIHWLNARQKHLIG